MRIHPFLAPLLGVVASVALARDSHVGVGSAIVPAYSIRSEALAPSTSAWILGCVTNDNPHSTREIVTGDSFSLHFGDGAVVACPALDVHSPSASLAETDFTCDVVDAARVTISYRGPTVAWLPGEQVCARVEYMAPAKSASVRCEYSVSNNGAYAPPMPHYLVLGIDEELALMGPPGPVGPEGPVGPPGPPGPSVAGGRWLLESTGPASAPGQGPPIPVPGLTGALSVSDGSSLMITVDGIAWACAMASNARESDHARILLRLDGAVVAQRSFSAETVALQVEGPWRMPVGLSWLSSGLSAGTHQVSVEVWNPDGFDPGSSGCVGSATEPELKARLVAVELRP